MRLDRLPDHQRPSLAAADAVVAVGGRHGTRSEIGLALRMGRHVVALSSWRVESEQRIGGPRVRRAYDAREAAQPGLRLAKEGRLSLCDSSAGVIGNVGLRPARRAA